MTTQATVIQGTAKEIREALALIPDDEIVSLMVGRPSLSIIARKLQHEAATLGITAAEHDALMASLKLDILTAVKRTAIPKPHDLGFCFFPLRGSAPAAPVLLCSGLMVATRTDTASPAAKMFLLALISRSWCVPQIGQSHSRIFNGIFKGNIPAITTPFRARKPSI